MNWQELPTLRTALYTLQQVSARSDRTLLGRELIVSLRDSKGASSLGDSSGCVTVKALESSSRELGRALHTHAA